MTQRERRLDPDFTTTFADMEVGSWSMTPGVDHDVEADEIFVVLEGRGTVGFDGTEESVDLSPGAVVRLYAGERTTWTVTETVRKVYFTPRGPA